MTDPLKYLFLFFVFIYQLCAQVPVAESRAESGEPIPVAQGEEAQVANGFGSGSFLTRRSLPISMASMNPWKD